LLPVADGVWGALNLDKGVLICPTYGTKYPNGYGYNNAISGLAIGEVANPSETIVCCDGKGANNIITTPNDVDARHAGKVIASYLDGHAEINTIGECISSICVAGTDLMTGLPSAGTSTSYAADASMMPNTTPWLRGVSVSDAEAWPPNGSRTYIKHYSSDGNPAPCILLHFGHDGGSSLPYEYFSRALPAVSASASWWAAKADVKFLNKSATDSRTEMNMWVKDTSGNYIVNIERLNWNWSTNSHTYAKLNGTAFITGFWGPTGTNPSDAAGRAELDNLFSSWRTLRFVAYGGKVTMIYGNYFVTVTPTAGSNWKSPGSFGFQLGRDSGGAGGNMDLSVDNIAFGTK
jgi:prepilin-type processing-associated H-X9-DG protein